MNTISENQKNFILNLISEAGEGAPSFDQIQETFNNAPEEGRNQVLDTYINTLRSMKRSRNEILPVTDETYEKVRECDAISGETTSREGLTEANALKYIKKVKIEAGTSTPTQGQREFLFKLYFQGNNNMSKDRINDKVNGFKTNGEISAEIDKLIEAQKDIVTPKQKRNLEWLLKKQEGMSDEEIKKEISGLNRSTASERLSKLFDSLPKKEAAPEAAAHAESSAEQHDDMPF
jgi:hypothetical protein